MKNKLILLVTGALIAALFPAGAFAQTAAPGIQLLNPSGYSTTPELSTKSDQDGLYHFVAWVPTLPPNPIVEFEIQIAGGNSVRTIDAQRVGTDTFEAFDNLANVSDGAYVVVARLYSSGVQVEGGSDSQAVTVRNSVLAQSDTVEITHPSNGGGLGFFTPKGAPPRALVDVRASEGTPQVRVLVTTAPPGTEPTWVQCGSGTPSGEVARVRCTLPEDVQPNAVTALAAVANQTPPPGAPQATADDAGDAHRVSPYVATPAHVSVEPSSIRAEVSTCRELTATVLDQLGRPISGANVDIHATGPSDQLQFATGGNAMDFQPPDAGPHSNENAHPCAELDPARQQGETNRIGQHDEKHIESRSNIANPGTNNQGNYVFALFSDVQGGTNAVVWADANDDDVRQATEASGGAQIGWGEDPPEPQTEVFLSDGSAQTVGGCARMTMSVRRGGSALSGVNADIHLAGSDAMFCSVDGGTAMSFPTGDDHTAGAHADGTRHGEGQTDASGQIVFGVSAASEGEVVVTGWFDETDDDVIASGEPTDGSRVSFTVSGDRDISLEANRRRVREGRRVRLTGRIEGAPSCSDGQVVKLRARVPGKRYKVIAKKRTNASGEYGFRPRVFKTKDYKAITPRNGVCDKARSPRVRVRVRG